jgi:CII-binding regulator of phage lambda lysogenization HflD
MLHGIPRLVISAASFGSKVLLRPACSAVIAVIWAQCTLASNTIISREAVASSGSSITSTLVGTLGPRVKIVGVHDLSNPGEIFRACSLRAIRASPLWLAVQTGEAFAVIVHFTSSMI